MGQAQPTLKEQIREAKRNINRSVRELDRERLGLERQQQKLELDIRKAAKAGHQAPLKIMTKDLVRTRRGIQRFHEMKVQLQGVAMQIQTVQSTEAMRSAMVNCTSAMQRMGARMRLPAMAKIARDFAMENERMGMTQEMMSDAMEDALEGDEDFEEEEEAVVAQVLGELSVETTSVLQDAPSAAPGSAVAAAASTAPTAVGVAAGGTPPAGGAGGAPAAGAGAAGAGGGDGGMSDLERRLNNLRK